MTEVKRHTVHGYGRQDIYYNEPDGEFVFYEDYAELKAQRDALAVECAALKKYISDKCFVEDDSSDYGFSVAIFPKAPATDAYLNSVRAEGVDMFAKYIALYNSNSKSHAESFSAQLRAGEPS